MRALEGAVLPKGTRETLHSSAWAYFFSVRDTTYCFSKYEKVDKSVQSRDWAYGVS